MDKRLLNLTSAQVASLLRRLGFVKAGSKGSHAHFKKHTPSGSYAVTVILAQSGFAAGTMKSMIRQSGHSEADWLARL